MHVEVREQLMGTDVLPPCGSQGLNSGSHAWHQELLPTEPQRQMKAPFLSFFQDLFRPEVVIHTFYFSTQEAEAGIFL